MHIWVDADACPVVIKEILFRGAERTGISLTLVANQYIKVPSLPNVKSYQVASGFDVADDEIVSRVSSGDLVITSDIPLAAEVIEKGALVVSGRGEKFTPANIKAKLNMRDFMDSMRGSGIHTGGPPALGQQERKLFAGHLDQYLATYKT